MRQWPDPGEKLLKFAAVAASALALTGATPPEARYAEGQVWEYHTRPGDEGSLLKIQKIERSEELAKIGPIYHISIIGIHFHGAPLAGQLHHAPFTGEALDASVTHLSASKAEFPDATPGIAQWRAARGGVFAISVAQAVDLAERTVAGHPPPSSPG